VNEEHIRKVKLLLTSWNPLGDQASQISDLNDYETEATDILFHINKQHSIDQITNLTITVLEQAFGLDIPEAEAKPYANQINKILREK
jgi:hypothetical protein